jgi:glycosyltransferase involved in cell wall biosynthesis/2-polyprenyl-3-methyl-5-hydroxy-6-metoxy-1,4-benzoquinol methylase
MYGGEMTSMNKYDFKDICFDPPTSLSLIINMTKPNSRILEFGPAHGRLAKYLKEKLNCIVDIVEIDEEAGKDASAYANDALLGPVEGNAENFIWFEKFGNRKYDYIIFADVLEHLYDPEAVIKRCRDVLNDSGSILISLPNIAHNSILINLYFNKFRYTELGLLDKTHIRFFAFNELEQLYKKAGYALVEFYTIKTPAQFTERSDFFEPGYEKIDRIICDRELGEVYQFVLRLQKSEKAENIEVNFDDLNKACNETCVTIFFNSGKGYNQQESETKIVHAEKHYKVKFDINNKEITSLRFDPSEGFPCMVKILNVQSDARIISVKPLNSTNSFRDDECYDEFLNFDPMYEIIGDFGNASHIIIEFELKRIKMLDFFDRTSSLVEKVINDIRINKKELELLREQDREHVNQLEIMKNNNAALSKQLDDICNENEILLEKFNQIQNEYSALSKRLEQANLQITNLNTQLSQTRMEAALSLRQINEAYEVIINSQCWKLTAPLRFVLDGLKKTKIGSLGHKTLRYLKAYGVKTTLYKARVYLRKKMPRGGWSGSNIINFEQMVKLAQRQYQGCVYLDSKIKNLDSKHIPGRRILLIGHEMNLTGAPVALHYFAKALIKNGSHPVIIAPTDGGMREASCGEGIPVILIEDLYYSDFVARCAHLFDLIVVNTIVGYPIIEMLKNKDLPVLWWIHEANASYTDDVLTMLPQMLPNTIHVYCGGGYAERILLQYRPKYKTSQLLYCVADYTGETKIGSLDVLAHVDNKTVFAIVGMQEERKGQDVVVDAILSMSAEQVERCLFVFVGKKCHPYIEKCIREVCEKYPNNVKYIEELCREDLGMLYMKMNCLICSSKDDPMPIVVTEALMLSKLVICSEHTGSAAILEEMNSGLVYYNDDPLLLRDCIIQVLEKGNELESVRTRARATYERYFSDEAFNANVEKIVSSLLMRAEGNEEPFKITSNSLTAFGQNFTEYAANESDAIYGREILEEYDSNAEGKKVLLLSHELSLTGAPIALHYLARSLKEQGDCPVVLSPFDGSMREEFLSDGIPVIIYNGIYATDFLSNNAFCFDLIILNTVVTFRAVTQLAESSTPVMWWIHDSNASYNEGGFGNILPVPMPQNVKIYCGGEYAKKCLLTYYPEYSAENLLYFVPDYAEMAQAADVYPLDGRGGKVVYTVIGMQDKRKGQDILVRAVMELSETEIERSMFLFIGQRSDAETFDLIMSLCSKYPNNVKYIPEVGRKDLISIYQQSDCIICSSRDDPMPVFVTEAMMFSKLIICSENTGSAALIHETGGGLTYPNNDPHLLAERIRYVLDNYNAIDDVRAKARITYETYFSKSSFDKKVRSIVSELSFEKPEENYFGGMVSVVIPTYNAGDNFADLLKLLKNQEGIRQIEVVVVDSGSNDRTIEHCHTYGVKLIQINNSEFSHSYARNLGANKSRGDILLFMTQDAFPTSTKWMYHIIEPIFKENVAAVSCKEQCPEGTELYYRVASKRHSDFLGVSVSDVVCSKEKCVDELSLRANAGLNDITCAVNKKIFMKFGYRFNYAEDLDLGVRLINNGYKLKLLASEQVLHGHNRTASYYMSRALLEECSLDVILSRTRIIEDTGTVARRIVKCYAVMLNILKQMRESVESKCLTDDFFSRLDHYFVEQLTNKNYNCVLEFNSLNSDKKVEEVVQMIQAYQNNKHAGEYDIIQDVKYYCDHILQPYVGKQEHFLDESLQEQVYDCIYKQTALLIGINFAHIKADDQLQEKINGLTRGI